MTRIRNLSDRLQVIPTKDGGKDLPVGATDTFTVAEDNPHLQAKVQAGHVEIVGAKAEPAKSQAGGKASSDAPGGKAATDPA